MTNNDKVKNILLESVWITRWNDNKTALTAVLTSEEAIKMVDDIINDLDTNGYKIIKK